MDVSSMSLFFALLALLAGTSACIVTAVASVPGAGALRADLADAALPLALAVAATSTAGSLYYSEIAGYTPCKLCWFQRIAMYPMVLLFVIALVRRDRAVRWYTLPLALVGAAVSVYHYQLQRFPSQASAVCSAEAPCTAKEVDQFGFVTIPFMALTGFALIAALMWNLHRAAAPDTDTAPDTDQE